MPRRKSLAEELAELHGGAKAPAPDPEDAYGDGLGLAAPMLEDDEELDVGKEPQRRRKSGGKGGEKGLRMRAGIALDDGEYVGKRTSRKDWLNHVGADSEDEAGSEDQGGSDEEEEVPGGIHGPFFVFGVFSLYTDHSKP